MTTAESFGRISDASGQFLEYLSQPYAASRFALDDDVIEIAGNIDDYFRRYASFLIRYIESVWSDIVLFDGADILPDADTIILQCRSTCGDVTAEITMDPEKTVVHVQGSHRNGSSVMSGTITHDHTVLESVIGTSLISLMTGFLGPSAAAKAAHYG